LNDESAVQHEILHALYLLVFILKFCWLKGIQLIEILALAGLKGSSLGTFRKPDPPKNRPVRQKL